MAERLSGAMPVARSEPRTSPRCGWKRSRCAIRLPYWSVAEPGAHASVALIDCFGFCCRAGGRGWREGLVIVQPETVLRWRREGWSALWGYRSRGRWQVGVPGFPMRFATWSHGWPVRTFSGVPRGSMASFACSASACPKPPCRATCRHQAEGQDADRRKSRYQLRLGVGADQPRDCGSRPTRCLTCGGTGQRYE